MTDNLGYRKEPLPDGNYPPPTYQEAPTSSGFSEVVIQSPSQQQVVVQPNPVARTRVCCYGAIQPTCIHHQSNNANEKLEEINANDWRTRVPLMPMWLAVTCLVINCILPGFGTLVASFSLCCCSSSGVAGGSKCKSYCTTFWVGWAQMISIVFFLVGYVWAIAWSIATIQMSSKYYGKNLKRINNPHIIQVS